MLTADVSDLRVLAEQNSSEAVLGQWISLQETIYSDLAVKANLGELQQVRKDVLNISSELHELQVCNSALLLSHTLCALCSLCYW